MKAFIFLFLILAMEVPVHALELGCAVRARRGSVDWGIGEVLFEGENEVRARTRSGAREIKPDRGEERFRAFLGSLAGGRDFSKSLGFYYSTHQELDFYVFETPGSPEFQNHFFDIFQDFHWRLYFQNPECKRLMNRESLPLQVQWDPSMGTSRKFIEAWQSRPSQLLSALLSLSKAARLWRSAY